jgi:hypothetical protein
MNAKAWTEKQVLDAFGHFFNPNSGNPEEAEEYLRNCLEKTGAIHFGPDDIVAVTAQMVPPMCVNQLAEHVIQKLNECAS